MSRQIRSSMDLGVEHWEQHRSKSREEKISRGDEVREGFSEGVTAVPPTALWDAARSAHVGAPGTP